MGMSQNVDSQETTYIESYENPGYAAEKRYIPDYWFVFCGKTILRQLR